MADIRGWHSETRKWIDMAVDGYGRVLTVPAESTKQKVLQTKVPGIGVAAAYASGDAFGTLFAFEVPVRGLIRTVTFIDIDNERVPKDLVIFNQSFTPTADNSAFAPSASDLTKLVGVISILTGDYVAFNANAAGVVTAIDMAYEAVEGKLYCQLVTRGADNIASGAEPYLVLVVE